MAMTEVGPPLAGLRVLDLTRVIAGPHCTRMLADLGAEIIKLEPPEGDPTRPKGKLGLSGAAGFVQLNAGKRFISIDLSREEGRDVVRSLIGEVDVLIENFRPGVMAAWKLDYDSIVASHPALIYVSISGYGQGGAWATRRAYAPFVHGEAGYLDTAARLRQAEVAHDPMSIADVAAAKDATIALLSAVIRRQRTQLGEHIDISLAHSILYFNEFAAALLTGSSKPRSGSTPQAIFETADGQHFSAGNPVSSQVFATLCQVFGCPELIDDPRFVDSAHRRERRTEVIELMQAALERLGPADEVEEALAAAGLAIGRIRTIEGVPDTPWAAERRAVTTVQTGGAHGTSVPSAPWVMRSWRQPDPGIRRLGADNAAVLGDVLHMTDTAISDLLTRGVLHEDSPAELDD
jgi:CoA:oxalate CoA-transferase